MYKSDVVLSASSHNGGGASNSTIMRMMNASSSHQQQHSQIGADNTNAVVTADATDSLASESYKVICSRLGIKPNATILQQLLGTDMAVAAKSSIDASQTFLGSHGVDALCELLVLHQGIQHISLPANGLVQGNVTGLTQAIRSHSALESIDLSNNKNLSTPAAREIWEAARANGSLLLDTKVDGTAIPSEWKQRIQRQLEINREHFEFGFDSNPVPRPRDQWLEVRIFLLAERTASEAVEKFMERTLSLLNAAGASWRVRFSCLVYFDDMLSSHSAETIRGHMNNCSCSMNYNLPWVIVLYTQDQISSSIRSFIKEYIEPLEFPELPPLYTKFGARREPLRRPFPSVFITKVPATFNVSHENSAVMSRDGSFYSAGTGSFHYSGSAGASGDFSHLQSSQNNSNGGGGDFAPPQTKAVRYFNSSRYPECATFLRLQTDILVSLRGVFYTPKDTRIIDFWTDAPDAFREGLVRLAAQFQEDASPSEVAASMNAQPKEAEQIYNYVTRTMTTQNAAPLLVYGSRGVGRRSVTQAALWHVREDIETETVAEQQQQQQQGLTEQNPSDAFSADFYQSVGSNFSGGMIHPKSAASSNTTSGHHQQQQHNDNSSTTSPLLQQQQQLSSPQAPAPAVSSSPNATQLRIVRWDMSINNSIVQFLMFLLDVFVPENRPLPTSAHNGNIELLMLTAQHAIRHYKGKQKIALAIFDVDLIDTAWATGLNPFGWFPLAFPATVRLVCTCATESNFLSEMRGKEQQPFDLLIRGGKRATLCRSLRARWNAITTASASPASSPSSRRPFLGLPQETETDEYHSRTSPPTSLPPTVAAAILTKQDSELFLYVNLFASWIALECEDLGQDEKMMIKFIHEVAPQTTHDLVQRMVQKIPFIIDKSEPLAERKARVFNTIACLCSAPALTSNEISRVCEQIYNNRRHSIVPLLTVLEHFGLISKRFDGCLAPAHPVIRTAFESFVQRDPSLPLHSNSNDPFSSNKFGTSDDGRSYSPNQNQYQHHQNAADNQQWNHGGSYDEFSSSSSGRNRHHHQREQDIWGAPPISPVTFRNPSQQQQQGTGGGGGKSNTTMESSASALFTNLGASGMRGLLLNNNNVDGSQQQQQQTGPRVPGTMELDACRSAFAVIHYHAVCNLTVGFIRSFSILPDLLIHSAQPQKLVHLLGDVVLLDSIVREHSIGSVYVVDAMIRAIHHLSALSHMFTIEGYTRHQFSHSADLGHLTRSLRDFLKIRSGNLWQAALALQHDSTLFQNAIKQFDKAPYPSLCLRNRTDSELQSIETHIPKLPFNNNNNSNNNSKSLRHCCLSDPFLAVTCESGFVTIYEITKIGGLRVAAKQAQHQQQQQQKRLDQQQQEQTSNNNNAKSDNNPNLDDQHHQCFRELCSYDFSTIGFDGDGILGCVISSGMNPTALVVFVNHCAVWRFTESPKSPGYISKIENCTTSLRHDVFAPGGSTFAGVAFLEGDGAPTAEETSKARKRQQHPYHSGANDGEQQQKNSSNNNNTNEDGVITPASFTATDVERKVVIVDVASAKILSVVNHPSAIFVREAHYVGAAGILVIEPQGVVLCRNDGIVLQMRSHHLSQAHSIRACAHNRDGSLVGVVSSVRAMMWHVGRNQASHEEMPLHTITANSPLLDLSFVPSGAQAAIAAEDGNILMWNTITGLLHQTLRLDTPDPPAYCIFTSNGRLVARAGTALRMWDVVTNQDMGGIVAHEGVVNYIEASGSLLATCCDCGTVKIWDATPSLPPLTKLKDSGKPTNDLYRFGFVGPHRVTKIAVSDDSSFVAIQIGGGAANDDDNNINNNHSSSSSPIQTSLWGVDLDHSPMGEYESTAPFIRDLPPGLTSSPLFLRHLLSSAQRAREEEEEDDEDSHDGEDENEGHSHHHRYSHQQHQNSGNGGRGRSPVDDPTILLFVNAEKQLVKHFCETGESIVIGELPREVLDGYVEMYHRCDAITSSTTNTNPSSSSHHHHQNASSFGKFASNTTSTSSSTTTTSIAISTGKTLGGCRIVLYDVPLGSSTEPATLIAQLIGHGGPIIGIDYLPTAVVSAAKDKQLIMWSTTSYAEKASKVFDAPLVAFARIFEGEYRATSPGTYCVADADGGVMIVDCKQASISATTTSSPTTTNNHNNNKTNNNNTTPGSVTKTSSPSSPAWKITVIRKVLLPHCVLLAQSLLNPNTLLISLEGSEGELFVWDTKEMKPINRVEITRSSVVNCMTMVSPQIVENNPTEVDENGLLVFAGTETGVVKMYSVEG